MFAEAVYLSVVQFEWLMSSFTLLLLCAVLDGWRLFMAKLTREREGERAREE